MRINTNDASGVFQVFADIRWASNFVNIKHSAFSTCFMLRASNL